MKVIVDTNILISAVIKDRIPEKVILEIISNPLIFWIASKDILNEYFGVLSRPKFQLDPYKLNVWKALILESTIMVNTVHRVNFPIDKKD